MFRTRDFLLFLVMVAFLVIAITYTVKTDIHTTSYVKFSDFVEPTNTEYKAVAPEQKPDERPKRLEVLRNKIATIDLHPYTANLMSATGLENEDDSDGSDAEKEILSDDTTVKKCSNYQESKVVWSPQDLNFEMVEGARVVYREVDNAVNNAEGIKSSAVDLAHSNREVVMQLPVRSVPFGSKKCLSSDVVGIALDGSLIRNDEQSIYGVFGAETLIGYALDGFPIYGLNKDTKTDSCGGMVVAGQYRYYLSTEREGVIGCYSAEPKSI